MATSEQKSVNRPKPPSRGLTFAVFIATALLVLVLIGGFPKSISISMTWAVKAVALLFLLLLLAYYTIMRYYLPQTRSHLETHVWPLPDEQVDIIRRSAGRPSDVGSLELANVAQTKVFALSIVAPASIRQRLTERYEPGHRTLIQRVTMDVQVPERLAEAITKEGHASDTSPRPSDEERANSGQINVLLFPVVVPKKGALIDNLAVVGADQAALPVLSYRQYLQLIARVLRTLLVVAHGGDIQTGEAGKILLEAERLALAGIMRRPERAAPDESGIKKMRDLVKLASRKGDDNLELADPEALRFAAELVEKLTSHYAVVVAIPCQRDGRFVVTYERSITPELDLVERKAGALSSAKARLRLFLGARPVDLSVALVNAGTSQSYHLVIDGPDQVFVGVQESPGLIDYLQAHVDRLDRIRSEHVVNDPPPPPYFRFRRRAGQRYAHFYSRYFPHPIKELKGGTEVPNVRFRFYEVPPGSVFRAAVAAGASATLVWLVGFILSRTGDPGSDVPAFLLVFPAIAAGWLGFDAPSGRLLEGTLAARFSLLITALTSVAASGLFMIYKSDLSYLRWSNPLDMHVLGISSLSWSILAILAILNAVTIIYMSVARTWEFVHLSQRPDSYGEHKHHVGE